MSNKKNTDYDMKYFEWDDIEKHLNQIIDMQIQNIYKFHYPEKEVNRNYIKDKILDIKTHLENGKTYFIGAKREEKLLGYVWCYQGEFMDEKRMNINSIFICEEFRNMGLGHSLMGELKKLAANEKCDTIGTHYACFNKSAGDYYMKNGFKPTRIELVFKLDDNNIV